jgi:hypothetical protein
MDYLVREPPDDPERMVLEPPEERIVELDERIEPPALEERIVELLDERIEEVALEERTGVVVDRDTDGAVLREGLVVVEVRTVVFVERTGAAADVLVRVVALRVAEDVVALRVAAVVVVAVRVAVVAEVARTLELPKVRFIVASRRIPVAD